jgi:hypothetical protein
VLAFGDAASAQRALTTVMTTVKGCALHWSADNLRGASTFTKPDGGVSGEWITSGSPDWRAEGYVDPFFDASNQRIKPDSPMPGIYYINNRALALKGNTVVDVSARRFGVYFQHWKVIREIMKNLT